MNMDLDPGVDDEFSALEGMPHLHLYICTYTCVPDLWTSFGTVYSPVEAYCPFHEPEFILVYGRVKAYV